MLGNLGGTPNPIELPPKRVRTSSVEYEAEFARGEREEEVIKMPETSARAAITVTRVIFTRGDIFEGSDK